MNHSSINLSHSRPSKSFSILFPKDTFGEMVGEPCWVVLWRRTWPMWPRTTQEYSPVSTHYHHHHQLRCVQEKRTCIAAISANVCQNLGLVTVPTQSCGLSQGLPETLYAPYRSLVAHETLDRALNLLCFISVTDLLFCIQRNWHIYGVVQL